MRNNNKRILIIKLFLLLLALTETKDEYLRLPKKKIIQKRLPQIQKYCGSLNRSVLQERYLNTVQPSITAQTYMETYINFTFAPFKARIMNNQDTTSKFFDQNAQNLSFFVGFFILCAVILGVITWPIMLLCLYSKFPMCRQPRLQPYNLMQQRIPVVAVILMGIGVVFFAGFGLNNSHVSQNYHDTSCAIMIIFDDMINGNVRNNQSLYWAGTRLIYDQLLRLNESLITNISGLFDLLLNQTSNFVINTTMDKLFLQLQNIAPLGLRLQYNIPLNQAHKNASKIQLPSTFNKKLGPNNFSQLASDNVSLKGVYFSILSKFNSARNRINFEINNFRNVSFELIKNVAALSQWVRQNNTETQKLITAVQSVDSYIENSIRPQLPVSVDFVEYFIYISWILLSVFSILSLILMMFYQQKKYRQMLFGGCTLVVIYCIIMFSLAAYISYLTVFSYSMCTYVNETISNPIDFINNVNFNNNADNNTVKVLANCLKDSNGDFFSNLTLKNVNQTMQNTTITDIFQRIRQKMILILDYDGADILKKLQIAHKNLVYQIEKQANTSFIDFENIKPVTADRTPSLETIQFYSIKRIPNSVFYIKNATINPTSVCKENNFRNDSWLPHLEMQNLSILCRIVKGKRIQNKTQCLIDQKCYPFTTPSNVSQCTKCLGCIDTVKTLAGFNSEAEITSFLNTLYPNCSQFVINLTNLWKNYYQVRKLKFVDLFANLTLLNNTFVSFPQILDTFFTIPIKQIIGRIFAQSQLKDSLDPANGIIAGLNCTLFGDDLTIFKNALCKGSFEYLYLHRIAFIEIGFFSLFMSCCLACALKRNDPQWNIQQHSEEKLFTTQVLASEPNQANNQKKSQGIQSS